VLTSATFPAALTAATAGSVLELGPGAYGNLVIYNRTFPDRLTIKAADPASPPVFNSGLLRSVDGVSLEGLSFAFQPTMTTPENQNVVAIEASKNITLTGCKVSAGMAINGVPETATVGDAFGTVTGWPLGRGVYVQLSSGVTIAGCEVWNVQRGIAFYKAVGLTIEGTYVHDVRRTFILGDACDLTIRGNRLWGSKPWRWGQTPIGDHGDFIALYPSNLGPMSNVVIADNVCEQRPDGAAILGFTMASINGLDVRGNVISGSDHQGFVATAVTGLKLYDNRFTGRAQILLRLGTVGARGANNLYAGYADYSKGTGDNQIAPSGYVAPPPPPDPRDVRIAALEADLASALDRLAQIAAIAV
jgi:hypothetical protein